MLPYSTATTHKAIGLLGFLGTHHSIRDAQRYCLHICVNNCNINQDFEAFILSKRCFKSCFEEVTTKPSLHAACGLRRRCAPCSTPPSRQRSTARTAAEPSAGGAQSSPACRCTSASTPQAEWPCCPTTRTPWS